MISVHNAIGTYSEMVDRYIALSEFSKQRFVAGGLPQSRVTVKANCIYPDPRFLPFNARDREYLLYIGRFSTEKGTETFARSLRLLRPEIRVRIIGDGPLRNVVQEHVADLKNVSIEGWVSRGDAQRIISGARLIVCPSECFENFPMTVLEAFAVGTPVLCSRIGVYEEIVNHGETGIHFSPGEAEDLAKNINALWSDESLLAQLARNARGQFENLYTADKCRDQLLSIYAEVLGTRALSEAVIAS